MNILSEADWEELERINDAARERDARITCERKDCLYRGLITGLVGAGGRAFGVVASDPLRTL